MPDYTLDAFVQDLQGITAAEQDIKSIIRSVTPLAKRIASDIGWVKPSFYDCDADQGFGITVLHEEPQRLLVEAIAWLPGRGVAPHDHQTWGVVVGLDGPETNLNWRRQDDGSTPGRADVVLQNEVVVGAGDVIGFLPYDIHSVKNDSDQTTLSLHIYGKSLAHIDRSEFDPAAGTVRPCPKRKRNAAD